MKTFLWSTSMLGTPVQRRLALRPYGRNSEAFQLMLNNYDQVVQWADELGFDAFGSAEHHFQAEGGETLPNALLVYAKLAAKTKQIMFAPLTIILTATNPLRVAEDLALFDHMYPGRIGVGLARGYMNRWVQTMTQDDNIVSNQPASDARNREIFDEYMDVLELAWAQDSFKYDGKHFKVPYPLTGMKWPPAEFSRIYGGPSFVDDDNTVREIGVLPKPLNRPTIFTPSVGSRQTVLNAARNGNILLSHGVAPEDVTGLAELYRDTATEAGRDIALGDGIGLVVKLFFGDTYEEAFELAVSTAGFWYQNILGPFGFNESLRADGDPPAFPLDLGDPRGLTQRMVDRGVMFCGTKDHIQEKVAALHKAAGNNLEWLTWEFWPQAAPADALEIQRYQLEAYAESCGPSVPLTPQFGRAVAVVSIRD